MLLLSKLLQIYIDIIIIWNNNTLLYYVRPARVHDIYSRKNEQLVLLALAEKRVRENLKQLDEVKYEIKLHVPMTGYGHHLHFVCSQVKKQLYQPSIIRESH